MSAAVVVDAPAKVNLVLRVGGPPRRRLPRTWRRSSRRSGLRDRLRVERAAVGHHGGGCTGADLGDPRDNLVYRAARAYLDCARASGAGWPSGWRNGFRLAAGWGAAPRTRRRRCAAWTSCSRPPAGVAALTADGARPRCADVPFFLSPSPLALGSGRGDHLTPLPPLPSRPVLLVGSPNGVGTAWAYDLLARGRRRGGGEAVRPAVGSSSPRPAAGIGRPWPGLAHNDFEAPIFGVRPDLRETMLSLRDTSPMLALMSGSGSTVFAVYRDDESAAASPPPRSGRCTEEGHVHLTTTLSRFPAIRPA